MKFNQIPTLILAGAIFFTSCEQAPKSDEAKTGEAEKVDTKKAEDANELKLDTKTSEVSWVGSKPTGKHMGTFALTEGKISVKDGQVTAGSFVIDVKSLKVTDKEMDEAGKKKLAGHLASGDFFDAEKFATAKFEITEVKPFQKPEAKEGKEEKKEEKKDAEFSIADPTHTVKGNLELKGVTKSIEFPAKITIAEGKAEAEAKFNINRKDWGMSYGTEESLGDKILYPTVNIGLKLVANK